MGAGTIPAQRRDAGYTLIELLISLSILAFILAMVPGTLRLGKRAWETPAGLEETPAAAALAFAEQQLRSALPIYETNADGLPQMIFAGTSTNVGFIAELAEGPAGGGLYRIEIGAPNGRTATSSGLAVRLRLYRPDVKPGGATAEERDLEGIYSDVRFSYFGSPAPGAQAQWQSTWPRNDRLPDLVDIVATPRNVAKSASAQYRAELKLRPVL